MRILSSAAYRKIGFILIFVLATYGVVLAWGPSAQDNALVAAVEPLPTAEVMVAPILGNRVPILTIEPIERQKIGRRVMVTAMLVNADGDPQGNKPLHIFVDGRLVRRARTDDNGIALVSLGSDLSLGHHDLEIHFIGTEAYSGVDATATFTIDPLVLTLETVPTLAGIPLLVDGHELATDTEGRIAVNIYAPGEVNLQVLQAPDTNIDDNTRVSFVRWSDENFQPSRTLNVVDDEEIQIGFSVSHPIMYDFIDLGSEPVDPTQVSELLVRTSTGDQISLAGTEARWLTATQIARRRTGLEATNVLYSIESVMIDGTNVVNRYQQRFLAQVDHVWTIQLLLYSATIRAADAFFGFSVGSGISLEYPDGHVLALPFDPNKMIHLDSLPRGTYRVKVDGVQSLTGWTPIALSRDQDVELQVFSVVDALVVVAAGIMIAMILLFYGRPFILKLPLLVYHSLQERAKHRAQGLQTELLSSVTSKYDLYFFYTSELRAKPNESALASIRSTSTQLHRYWSGNVLQISGITSTAAKTIRVNLPVGRLLCFVISSTRRRRLLVDVVSCWQMASIEFDDQHLGATSPLLLTRETKLYNSIFAEICSIYAELPASKDRGYLAKHFNFNSRRAQCKNCKGNGKFEHHSVAGEFVTCPVCNGTGYKNDILQILLNDKSIAETLELSVKEAVGFFTDYPVVAKKLEAVQALGLGDLLLGEAGVVLDLGESTNAKKLIESDSHILYVFNKPQGKLSLAASARQVTALAELLGDGSTIRIIEKNTPISIIKNPIIMVSLGTDQRDEARTDLEILPTNRSGAGADLAQG